MKEEITSQGREMNVKKVQIARGDMGEEGKGLCRERSKEEGRKLLVFKSNEREQRRKKREK